MLSKCRVIATTSKARWEAISELPRRYAPRNDELE